MTLTRRDVRKVSMIMVSKSPNEAARGVAMLSRISEMDDMITWIDAKSSRDQD